MKSREENKKKTPLLIWGASGQAEVVTDILSSSHQYTIASYIDDSKKEHSNNQFLDRPVLRSFEEVKQMFDNGVTHAIVAIGDIKTRKVLSQKLIEYGFTLINAIHETAIISQSTDIGVNTIIKAGSVIDPGVSIGNHSYIGAGVTIAHHTKIGNCVNVTGGVKISGSVNIGNYAFIGTGSAIKDRVTIGDEAIIGVGSVVVSDIPAHTTAKGVPAKQVHQIK